MENKENMHLVEEEVKPSAVSENLKITEILKLCFQPETKEELDNILLNFREKVNDNRTSEYFCRFDDICIYALDYIYKHDTASFSAVCRSLFLYQMQYQLVLNGTDRNLIFNCDNDCFLKELRQFKDLHTYSKSEEMLIDVGIGSILTGNLGVAQYLVKFGLIEFPSEVNEKCRKMFEILVGMFNSCSKPLIPNGQADETQTSVQLDELLNQVKEKEINVRRSLLILSILVIVAEYQKYQKVEEHLSELKFYTEHKKDLCLEKLKCIDLFIKATTDAIITFKDIENFTEVFLNRFITAEVGKTLVKTSRKIVADGHIYYNPRSLKDLARFKVRSSLRNPMHVPEQVNQLNIPVALKEFLNFHSEGIWELLLINHINLTFEQKLNRRTPEIEDGNEQAVENGNERELDDVNMRELENENVLEPEDANGRELDDGNAHGIEDGNLHKLEDGNFQELDDGNLHKL